MYADDTSLLVNGNDLHSLIASLNNALKDLCTWFKSNKLFLNTNKTFYIIFHWSRIKCDSRSTLDIIMDNSILRKTSSLKYLGAIVDQKLNLIEHMCVGATKGTYRRDIKMIANHDYIKQCTVKKFGLIILANIVYLPFN